MSMRGKVVLVTGATDGIGKVAALKFAKMGAHLTIIGRNAEKTINLVNELQGVTGNKHVSHILCDLSKPEEAVQAANQFMANNDKIDVLVNNAGAIFDTVKCGHRGIEQTFALNHLSYFQLTTSLLDIIKRTPRARVVSTSSGLHSMGRLDLKTTPFASEGSPLKAYATSKLANILFTKELQNQLQNSTAVANCFEPGLTSTSFGSNLDWRGKIIFQILKPFARTAEQGADSLIWLATSEEAGRLKGEYVANRRPVAPSNIQVTDKQLAEDLWTLSDALCRST